MQNQFLGNRETRTLLLDAAFRNFVQGQTTYGRLLVQCRG
jgi:hypothetical protein